MRNHFPATSFYGQESLKSMWKWIMINPNKKDKGTNEKMKHIILASSSPRRKELLEQIGICFEVRTSGAEEVTQATDSEDIAQELSKIKAQAVWDTLTDEEKETSVVLGADTIVCARTSEMKNANEVREEGLLAEGFCILGKPKDEADAARMLRLLSGRVHQVFTGVTLIAKEETKTFYECTDVHVASLSDKEIADYVATKESMDKAGAYGIQGIFAKHIIGIEGSYSNVMGLPVCSVYRELKSFLE